MPRLIFPIYLEFQNMIDPVFLPGSKSGSSFLYQDPDPTHKRLQKVLLSYIFNKKLQKNQDWETKKASNF